MGKASSTASAEQRVDTRFRTKNVTFPGKLIHIETGKSFEFRPVDVSMRGMGFLTKEQIPVGRYRLTHTSRTINVEIIYCQNHLGIDNLYRGGLFVRDENCSLRGFLDELELTLEPIRVNPPLG